MKLYIPFMMDVPRWKFRNLFLDAGLYRTHVVYKFAIGEITRKGRERNTSCCRGVPYVRTYSSSTQLYFLPLHHSNRQVIQLYFNSWSSQFRFARAVSFLKLQINLNMSQTIVWIEVTSYSCCFLWTMIGSLCHLIRVIRYLSWLWLYSILKFRNSYLMEKLLRNDELQKWNRVREHFLC